MAAAGAVPDAATIVIERVRDELGDWRVCVLSPRGGRIHAPWAMAAAAKIREETGIDVETLWGDDGFVVRFPDVDRAAGPAAAAAGSGRSAGARRPPARRDGAVRGEVPRERGAVAPAAEAPSRHAGAAVAAAQARRRSAGRGVALRIVPGPARNLSRVPARLLRHAGAHRDARPTSAAGRSGSPRSIPRRRRRLPPRCSSATSRASSTTATRRWPSGAPRRWPSIRAQLRELLGDAELRELLDADAMDAIERQLQRLDPQYQREKRRRRPRHAARARRSDRRRRSPRASISADVADSVGALVGARRVLPVRIAGEPRFIAVEDAARYPRRARRAAAGRRSRIAAAAGARSARRSGARATRARTRRSPAPDFAARYGLPVAAAEAVLMRLTGEGRLVEGEFRPGGTRREWTDPGVLRMLRRPLAREAASRDRTGRSARARPFRAPHGRGSSSGGTAPMRCSTRSSSCRARRSPASILETEILPARIDGYDPADLDAVTAAGEVVWVGVEPLGERDGRDRAVSRRSPAAAAAATARPPLKRRPDDQRWRPTLQRGPGSVSRPRNGDPRLPALARRVVLRSAARGGRRRLSRRKPSTRCGISCGKASSPTTRSTRCARSRAPTRRGDRRRRARRTCRRSARGASRRRPPKGDGRWCLGPWGGARSALEGRPRSAPTPKNTRRRHQMGRRADAATARPPRRPHARGGRRRSGPRRFRHRLSGAEGAGRTGRIRRGYFVAGLGATQFALPGALDLLRSLRDAPDDAWRSRCWPPPIRRTRTARP